MYSMPGEEILGYAGLLGVVLYLGSYAALQTGFVRGSSYAYAMLNLFAASLVLVSLFHSFNLSSAIIQIAWIVISIVGIIRLYIIRNWVRFGNEEVRMIAAKFPGIPNDLAKRLLRHGEWLDGLTGSELTRDGEAISHLYFLAGGKAEIERDGESIAIAENGDFIGEITCFDGRPANGTARLVSDGRLFRIPVAKLRELAPDGSALRIEMDKAIASDLRTKLARSNGERPLANAAR